MAAIFDRRSLLLGAVALSLTPSLARAAAKRLPRILFVCQYGTVKSPIARELLKRRAAQRGVPVAVTARGITPENHATPELLQRLARDGINPAAEPLRRLRPRDIASADLVIAFDKLPAHLHPRRFEDWSDLASMLTDYDQARAVLDRRIGRLLDGLAH